MAENVGIDPSQAAGSAILPHMERLRAAMDDVVPLLENTNEAEAVQAASAYTARRAQELSAADQAQFVGMSTDGKAHGTRAFISPDTSLSMAGMSRSYRLDDPAALESSFIAIRTRYAELSKTMPREKAYLNAVIAGANHGQAFYFQGYFGNSSARLTSSFDIIDEDAEGGTVQGASSIADYKGTALCLERAAVTHDTLLIYGVDSSLHAGHLTTTSEEGPARTVNHAFVTFPDTAGDEHILDPTNPTVAWNPDGSIAVANPTIYKRAPGVAEQTVELNEYNLIDGQAVPKTTHKLTYTFDPTIAST